MPGDFDDDVAFDQLRRTIEELDRDRGTGGNHAFYLSIPPKFFGDVVGQLKEHGLAEPPTAPGAAWSSRSRSATTCESARELNDVAREVFPPGSVFRIDHYLGKETVQNILALRFANKMFEPIWNANYVDHVQITMAEDIGIGGRAGYYDGIGAARDVIQNHLLQLMALVAMEEPTSFDAAEPAHGEAEGARQRQPPAAARPDHRARAVRRRLGGRRKVAGFLEEEGIPRTPPPRRTPRSSSTSTPGAGPACRSTCAPASGSGRRVTEVAVVFKRAPHLPFTATGDRGARARTRW